MGIRIHKVMGYGFVLTEEEYDSVINTNHKGRKNLSMSEYLEFLERKEANPTEKEGLDLPGNDISWLQNDINGSFNKITSRDFVTIADMPDGKTAVVVTPFIVINEWKHSDDAIDYAEAEDIDDELMGENSYRLLKYGQFPYSGSYMDSETGQVISKEIMDALRFNLDNDYSRRAAAESGYESIEQAISRKVPNVPTDVVNVCEWLELFVNVDSWKRLRPMIITDWS